MIQRNNNARIANVIGKSGKTRITTMSISRALRFQILKRDGFKCYYCHVGGVELQVDHVIPEALGGTDDPSNLVAACEPCNTGKAAVPPDAPLVASVAEDAQRWAAAMQFAAETRAEDRQRRYQTYKQFAEWWEAWKYRDGSTVDVPDDWTNSIDTFENAGLTLDDFHELIRVAMSAKTNDEWRYFCGCAWRQIREAQAVARAFIDRGI